MSEMSAGVPTPEQPQGNAPQSGQPRTQGTPGGVKKRRRGKRGGRNRNKTRVEGAAGQLGISDDPATVLRQEEVGVTDNRDLRARDYGLGPEAGLVED